MEDRPKVVSDIEFGEVTPLFRKNKKTYLIGSRARDRVICTSSEQVMLQVKRLSGYLNGENSLQDIHELCGYEYKTIDTVLDKMYKAGLLEEYKGIVNSELELVAKDVISIKTRQPSVFIQKFCKQIVRMYPIMIVFLFFTVVLMLAVKKENPFLTVYSGGEIIAASIIMYIFTVFHEFGHLIVAWSENIEVDSIKISLRWYVIPIIYVKYRGLNFLQPRIKAKMLLGGLSMNLFCALVGLILWSCIPNKVILLLSMYNFTRFIASLYPQTLSDGYFLLLLLTNYPSIRTEAVRWICSPNKTCPSKRIVLFICLYIFCTVGGLVTTYLFLGETIKSLCNRYHIDSAVIMICCSAGYIYLIINMMKRARKKLLK